MTETMDQSHVARRIHFRLRLVVGAAIAIVVVTSVAAMVPVRPIDRVSHSTPALTYGDAMERATRRLRVDALIAAPGGSTLLLTHGARAARVIVLFHGFTDSPRQFAFLAARLFRSGDNVYVPRLPHHAERNVNVASLASLRAEELAASADSAIDVAHGLGDSIIVAGVSAGGTITAWAAENRSDIRRAVIISPLFEIGRMPSFLDTPLANLAVRLPNVNRPLSADPERPDRHPGMSTHAIAELLRLAEVVRSRPSAVPRTGDVIFVVNANDHTVKTSPTLALARDWSSRGDDIRMYEFPRSLDLPHDLAEAEHANGDTAQVYRALESLIHGQTPPQVLAGHQIRLR